MSSRRCVWATASLFVMICGGDAGHGSRLEKQNQEIKSQLNRQETSQIYDLGAKCSQEAQGYFRQNWAAERLDKMTAVLDYQTHYNRSMNKCLILTRRMTFIATDGQWHAAEILEDVHERTKYADFYELHTGNTVDLNCQVGAAKCTSKDDFDKLIEPYMTN